jgi:DivIVA domain-containing protein
MARLRSPGFTEARRGYDKHEVDRFLEQLVDWLETDAAQDIRAGRGHAQARASVAAPSNQCP